MPVRLVTVIPPQQAVQSGQLLPWERCVFLSQETVPFLAGWKSVCGKLHKGRNATEPARSRARGRSVGRAAGGHCSLRPGTAWGLPNAHALHEALASVSENEPLARAGEAAG